MSSSWVKAKMYDIANFKYNRKPRNLPKCKKGINCWTLKGTTHLKKKEYAIISTEVP